MKFGTVPLAEARGGVLAHSLRIGGVSLKKGRRLDDDDLASLNSAELTEVTVARPEAGDVDEDRAAASIGGVVAGNGVSAEAPFTGRVNLLATRGPWSGKAGPRPPPPCGIWRSSPPFTATSTGTIAFSCPSRRWKRVSTAWPEMIKPRFRGARA